MFKLGLKVKEAIVLQEGTEFYREHLKRCLQASYSGPKRDVAKLGDYFVVISRIDNELLYLIEKYSKEKTDETTRNDVGRDPRFDVFS